MKIKNLKRNDTVRIDTKDETYFTKEGYLIDTPIVTRIGIFEYHNPDGTVRKEFRPPEEVFSPESLASYEGKPVIITHDAGYVTKDNASDEEIGTMLGQGFRDGNDVKVKIVIHDTDSMKDAGMKELSLGYNLDLDETEGEFEGEHYDAVQRNIRINHLALVSNARAGDEARLNIDSKDKETTEGGKVMKKVTRRDESSLSPEDFAKEIEAFKKRKTERMAEKGNAEEPEKEDEDDVTEEKSEVAKDDEEAEAVKEPVVEGTQEEEQEDEEEDPKGEDMTPQEKVQMVKDRRDRRDGEDEPEDKKAMKMIADQDEDIDTLLSVIEAMEAEKDMSKDSEDNAQKEACTEDGEDEEEEKEKPMNADSVDKIISQKLSVCRVGDRLNMDGLEAMSLIGAKKAIIKKVEPSIRLDGKSKAYINACYDIACEKVKKRKDVGYQRSQMMNGVRNDASEKPSAMEARERMISRREGGNE